MACLYKRRTQYWASYYLNGRQVQKSLHDLHPKNWSIQNESPPGKLGSQDRRTGPCGRAGFQRSRSLGC